MGRRRTGTRHGNVYRSVREKRGNVVYRQRVLQTVTSLRVVSLVFRGHDLLKIANINPQHGSHTVFAMKKISSPRECTRAEMEPRSWYNELFYLPQYCNRKIYLKVFASPLALRYVEVSMNRARGLGASPPPPQKKCSTSPSKIFLSLQYVYK